MQIALCVQAGGGCDQVSTSMLDFEFRVWLFVLLELTPPIAICNLQQSCNTRCFWSVRVPSIVYSVLGLILSS